MPDYAEDKNADLHLKLADKGYAYAQLGPGKHRIVSLMDFGIHEEAFLDKDRVAHVLKNYQNDFKITSHESDLFKNMRSCLRPQSVDDLPVIGPMSHFPNVILNLGHGGHGTSIGFACGKLVEGMVEGNPTKDLK